MVKHKKNHILIILMTCILLISLCSTGISAEKIGWDDKIPLDCPYFRPVLDGIRDEGYSAEYTVQNQLQNHKIHEGGSKLSVAWFGNTLYFYIRVPDATASETTSNLYYQIDNVWFLLYFGTEAESSVKWSQNESVKAFRILPFANIINFKGQCDDPSVYPPKSTDFEWRVLIEENFGYSIEVAYNIPESVATLENGFECAFDVEVLDVCEGKTNFLDYRYILGESRSENDLENFPYAYGAKIILSGGENTVTSETVVTVPSSESTPDSQSETGTVPEPEDRSGGIITVLGIAACAVCVAMIIAVVLSKKKAGKIIFAALALVAAILAALLLILSGSRETKPVETNEVTESEGADTTDAGKEQRPIKHEYFVDSFFKNGMTYTSNTVGGAILGRLSYSTGSPVWDFGQLGSKYEIVSDGTYTLVSEGVHQYEDESKLLYIDTNTGMFKMGIKGSKEYNKPRQGGQVFPGTLITTTEMAETVFIPDLASVEVTLDFTLDYVKNCMSDSEFNDGLHTAQWNYYAFISDSKSNEWFYVGLPLYDYRHEAGNSHGTDPGTGAFCYTPSYYSAFGDARVKVGERFTQTVDILPFIKTAFKTAQIYGYLKGCKLENMYVSGCNYGWELPGTFDCMATSYEFNMTFTLLEEAGD